MTVALPGAEGDYCCEPATADPFIHQEVIEILYHTLWETVHVFLERRERGPRFGRRRLSLPVSRPAKAGHRRFDSGGGRFHLMKAADDARLRARMAAESADEIWNASAAIAARVARGGKLILFGNGGSATDANDWALDCVLPPPGLPSGARRLALHGAGQHHRRGQRCRERS